MSDLITYAVGGIGLFILLFGFLRDLTLNLRSSIMILIGEALGMICLYRLTGRLEAPLGAFIISMIIFMMAYFFMWLGDAFNKVVKRSIEQRLAEERASNPRRSRPGVVDIPELIEDLKKQGRL